MSDNYPLCKCGCGKRVAKKGNKFIRGHNSKGIKISEETKRKISKANSGSNNGMFGKHHTTGSKEKISKNNNQYFLGKKLPKESIEKRQKNRTYTSGKDHPFYGKHHTEEANERNRLAHMGIKASDETKIKMGKSRSGSRNGSYTDGNTIEYCYKFNTICKENNRDKFNRQCFLCGKLESECKTRLDVHHVDYNKQQGCNSNWKLVPLCKSCHSKTSHKNNKIYYENLLNGLLYYREMILDYEEKIDYRSLL